MTAVDRRVVDMEFNNKQFETGVQQSVKSLDNLKNGLKLEGAVKGLTNISNATKSINLQNISDGLQNLSNRFSNLGIIGITVLQNLTNSAINFGKQLFASQIIGPLKQGLQEYETQMTSIQTILANTAKEGTTLTQVNAALDELNAYSDKTIYNFTQMARNIGTFTAAGVKLDVSVSAIKGIANLAAVSGSTAEQASVAMYQLSQALASGTVKLMDWNSVVNAGMGGQVFQDALKETARVHGIRIDEMIKKEGSFRETLSKGWLSSAILTETLSKFTGDLTSEQLKSMGYTEAQAKEIVKLGELANDAATKVKTFSQLKDTLAEAVQSGWAQSWRIVVGDFEEAKSLFTKISNILGGMIGQSAEARNTFLAEWKAWGGRTALIEAAGRVFKTLLDIIAPIKQAFKDIFPPVTANALAVLCWRINELTKKFQVGQKTYIQILRIFHGIFYVFDILGFLVGKAVGWFAKLIGPVKVSGDGILEFIASIGDMISRFRNALRFDNLLGKSFEKLKNYLLPVTKLISNLVNLFDAIRNHGFNSMNTLLNLVNIFGGGIIPVFLSVTKIFTSFSNTLSKASEAFKKAFNPKDMNFKDLEKSAAKVSGKVEEGLSPLGKILTGAWNVFKKLGPVFSKIGEAIGTALGGIGRAIADAFKNMDFSKIFDAINSGLIIAILVGIKKFIGKGSSAFDGLTGILGDVKGILDGVRGSMEAWQKNLQAKTLMTIATAIGILTLSIIALSLIDSGKLTVALTAITAMFGELVGSMAILDKVSGGGKKMASAGTQMIMMSVAILILSTAVSNLAKLDQKQLLQGLEGIAALMAGLMVFTKVMSKTTGKMTKGLGGLILLAISLKLLVGVVEKLGSMDLNKLQQGLAGVGALLAELGVFMKIASKASMGIGKGAGLLLLAVSINILAKAIEEMGKMSWEQIGKGLATLAGALVAITAALKVMPKNTFSIGLGLLIVSSALLIISQAISSMGKMSWEEIAKGMAALGGSMAIIALGLKFMKKSLSGAAALIIVATALAIFTPALKTLGSMSLTEIGTGLLALAGIFVILGVAGLVLGPLAPVILTLAAAVLLFGIGVVAVGAGLLLFAAGLTALGVSSTVGAAAITLFVTTIIALIPMVILALVNGIVQFATLIAQNAPTLVAALVDTIRAMIAGVVTLIPEIVAAAMSLVTALLQELVARAPDVIQAGMDLLLALLKGIADNIGDIVEAAFDIIDNFLDAVAIKLPDIIEAGWNIVINLIRGLTDSVQKNLPTLLTEVGKLASAIVTGLVDGLLNAGQAIIDALVSLAKRALGWFASALGISSPSTEFEKLGKYIPLGVAKGIREYTNSVVDSTKDLGKKTLSTFAKVTSEITDAINDDFNMNPAIRPVVDLTDIISGGKQINRLLGQNLNISGSINNLPNMEPSSTSSTSQVNPVGPTIIFQQTNNSPKPLPAIEIYRQTRNQLSLLKGLSKL